MARVVVFALFAIISAHSATAECPAGSIKGLNKRMCYKVHAATLSWIEAEGRCKAEGGHLATVASCLTNGFLHKVATDVSDVADYWIGGVWNAQKADAWSWEDDSPWNYTNWAIGHPAKGPVCLAFNASSGKWASEDCSKPKSYLCQVPQIGHQGGVSAPPNLATPAPTPRCPNGWQYLEASNLCYAFLEHKRKYSWSEAQTRCSEAGGGLISISSRAVNDAVVAYALEAKLVEDDYRFLVIGASYKNSTGRWEWTDGSEMRYTNWHVGKPHSPWAYECGYMTLASPVFGRWTSMWCNQSSFAALCERKPFDVPQGRSPAPPNLPAPPPQIRCQDGWEYLEATNLCYAVMPYRNLSNIQTSYWDDAKKACSNAGGGLVSIPNKAVNDALLVIATDAKAKQKWVYLVIGASYNNATSGWEWSDGSEMRYTNWQVGKPHRSDTDVCCYMRISPDYVGAWVNEDCVLEEEVYAVMCEKEAYDV